MGELIDFYDGGDYVHIWGSEILERRTYLGSEILTTEKKYLGSMIDGKLTY